MKRNYYKEFVELAADHSALVKRRDEIQTDLARLAQLLQATFDMLTPSEQKKVKSIANAIEKPVGLKDGVLMALRARNGEWLTPPEIRDYLETIGFDFGAASARGLASITTTVKRMISDEVEAKSLESGQMAYRVPGATLKNFYEQALEAADKAGK